MTRTQATAIGFVAVLLWALLALFTVGSAPVPPLQLNAMCFAIGGVIGLIWTGMTTGFAVLRGVSWRIYAFGTVGLFGYHFLYFSGPAHGTCGRGRVDSLPLAPADRAVFRTATW